MSRNTNLTATKREESGKGVARRLRASGKVPAVIYGPDQEAIALTIDAHETATLFDRISVENTIVAVSIEGEKEPMDTLVREVQVHPFRSDILHVDFMRVTAGVAVDLEVPLDLTGTAEGVRLEGGILEQVIHELSVRCIPSMIPEVIEVDVTPLGVGDSLHVSDIPVPEGVEITTDPKRTVCVVALPAAEVEEETPEEELLGLEPAAEGAEEAAEAADADEESPGEEA